MPDLTDSQQPAAELKGASPHCEPSAASWPSENACIHPQAEPAVHALDDIIEIFKRLRLQVFR